MPFVKVYWKGLRIVLGTAKRYIDQHTTQLAANLSEPQMDTVNACATAINICLQTLPVDTPIE